MDCPYPRRHLSPEEAKLHLLALDQQDRAEGPGFAAAPLEWVRSHPYHAGAAVIGGRIVARLLFRPRRAKIEIQREGAPVAAAAKGGVVAALATYVLRQFFQRYLAERLMAQAQTYFLRAHQSSPTAPPGTPWEPAGRP